MKGHGGALGHGDLRDAVRVDADDLLALLDQVRVVLPLVLAEDLAGVVAVAADTADVVPDPRVLLQVVRVQLLLARGELLAAVLALVHHVLLLGVHHLHVSVQRGPGPEPGITLVTGKGLLSCMHVHVIGETGTVSEGSGTELALELFKILFV